MNISKRISLTLLLFIGLASTFTLTAQPVSSGPQFWVGYYGELATHPGIAVGAQFVLIDSDGYQLSAGPVIGFYVHPRNHIGLFIDTEIENRFILPFGLYFTLGANAGYYHTWLYGDGIYIRDGDEIVQTFDLGRPYAKSGGSVGMGWDFSRTGVTPLALFTRLDLFVQYPFNDSVLPHAAVLVGAVFRSGDKK